MRIGARISAFPHPARTWPIIRRGAFAESLDGFTSLHNSCRAALYWAFRGLPLDRGATVWIPTYHCGAEVQAIRDAGWKTGFYRIDSSLRIDLDDLQRNLRHRPGPVLVIHYFGIPQPDLAAISELCARQEQIWVEDCAHALFSSHQGRALGTFAPMAVFSLPKTLPVVEGGALRVVHEGLPKRAQPFTPAPGGKFSSLPYRANLREGLRRIGGGWAVDGYSRLLAPQPPISPLWSDALQQSGRYPDQLSGLTRRIAATADPAAIVESRRKNWVTLNGLLVGSPGYCKVFETLADQVCPLFLPIWVAQREPVIAALQAEQIETFILGAIRHPCLDTTEYPETKYLRNQVLCLPVHQQLQTEHLERMAACLRPLIARHGSRRQPSWPLR